MTVRRGAGRANPLTAALVALLLLEQHDVLLVLQQRTMQQRNGPLWVLGAQRLGQQLLLEPRKVDLDDAAHRGIVGKADIAKKAAPQESVGEFLLIVAGDDDDDDDGP